MLQYRFTDPGVNDGFPANHAWAVTIDWGNGVVTSSAGTPNIVIPERGGTFAKGTYTVTVTVRDKDGGVGTATKKITIK